MDHINDINFERKRNVQMSAWPETLVKGGTDSQGLTQPDTTALRRWLDMWEYTLPDIFVTFRLVESSLNMEKHVIFKCRSRSQKLVVNSDVKPTTTLFPALVSLHSFQQTYLAQIYSHYWVQLCCGFCLAGLKMSRVWLAESKMTAMHCIRSEKEYKTCTVVYITVNSA
jgi:hypothetical protein